MPAVSRRCFLAIVVMLLSTVWSVAVPRRVLAEEPKPNAPTLSDADRAELEKAKQLYPEYLKLRNSGKYAQAVPLLKKQLEIRRRILGTQHPDYAASLNSLGLLHKIMADYGRAEPFYVEALAIYKTALGTSHPDYAGTLQNLAILYNEMREYEKAEPLCIELLAVRKRTVGERHPQYARALSHLAVNYDNKSEYSRAEPLYIQALAIREKIFGRRHPDCASSLNNLASLYHSMGDAARAEPLFVEALAIRKECLGPRHRDYATTLNKLATLYYDKADYTRAEVLFVEAVAITKQAQGVRSADYATSLNNLARLYQTLGDYARAEPLHVEALAIRKEVLGERNIDYAVSMNNLALLYQGMGDDARAEPLLIRALEIRKSAMGVRHPAYATGLNNLAILYQDKGRYAQAEPLLLEALAIRKEVLGERHPLYALSLNNLALLFTLKGQSAQAERYYVEAVALRKEVLGDRHPDYAGSLYNLAMLYQNMGDYAKAEPLHVESLAIRKNVLGERHPELALSMNNLAGLYRRMGSYDRAEPLFREAVEIALANWDLAAVVQSERQQRAMGESLRHRLDTFLSFAATSDSDAELVYEVVLRWKGAVLVRQHAGRWLRSLGDPEVRKLAEQLQTTAGRLATSALATPAPAQQATWRKQLDALTAEKERLEAALSADSAEYRRSRAEDHLSPTDLQQALPNQAVLLDFLEHLHVIPPADHKGRPKYERRLAAFVVSPDEPVVLVDLGPTAAITKNVDIWRTTLGESPESQAAAAALRKKIWDPLVAHVGSAETVFISPDGALTRFPLAALPGTQPGTYLLEEKVLVVVPVPQLLPRMLAEPTSVAAASDSPKPSLLVVGDVDFDSDAQKVSQAAAPSTDQLAATHRTAPRSGQATFAPLPGAAQESVAIRDLFTQSFPGTKVQLLRQTEATETAFRTAAPEYRYLHLATHGYFAPPQLRSAAAPDDDADDFETRLGGAHQAAGFNPGLLSGLALAGANRKPEPGRDDGILTALEATELQLDGVELVTLSACETGLGATAGGEGLLGLQRAFQAAGAKNVVSSLWKVDDQATGALMRLFYENLWRKKQPPAEALRSAQLTILNNPDQIAPDATRALGTAKPLPETGKVAASSERKRTAVSRWAAFQLSGAGR
jgi:CHAT domain-containing protein